MDRPETRYAKAVDGVHIAYQVVGDGPTDIVYSAGFVSNVDTAWEEGHLPFSSQLAGEADTGSAPNPAPKISVEVFVAGGLGVSRQPLRGQGPGKQAEVLQSL